jgi:hypothetical protein
MNKATVGKYRRLFWFLLCIANGYFLPIIRLCIVLYSLKLSPFIFCSAKVVQQKEKMLFTKNWRNNINAADIFIEHRGVLYDTTRIDAFKGYKGDLKIYAAALPGAATVEEWQE